MSQLVRNTAEDLAFLIEAWDDKIADAALRRESTILRRLLNDGEYSRAWRDVGFVREPKVYAINFEKSLGVVSPSRVKYGQAGGAIFNGIMLADNLEINGQLSERELKSLSKGGDAKNGPALEAIAVSRFLKSAAIVVEGQVIRRLDLIEYVANKMGGAHTDTRRDPQSSKRAEISYVALDKLLGASFIIEKESIYYELLSIGQAVARSRDAKKFVKKARSMQDPS